MSVRTFLFCDLCNPDGIRSVDPRRRDRRPGNSGRRHDDGRAWFEGRTEEARSLGWSETDQGDHLCPDCQQRIAAWPGGRLDRFQWPAVPGYA